MLDKIKEFAKDYLKEVADGNFAKVANMPVDFITENGVVEGERNALLLALVVLLARSLAIAASARSPFGTFVAVGVTSMFAFHFLVNIGMTLGMMPITGLPLLFVSYGGSALLSAMFCVGLLLNISLRRERFTF